MDQNSPIPVPDRAVALEELETALSGGSRSTAARAGPANAHCPAPVLPPDILAATVATRTTVEDIDLQQELEDLLQHIGPRAHTRGTDLALVLGLSVPARLTIEPVRLHQMLGGLVVVCVHFSPRGEVIVEASLADDSGDTCVAPSALLVRNNSVPQCKPVLRFMVRDQSAGIAADKLYNLLAAPSDITQAPAPEDWEGQLRHVGALARQVSGKLTLHSESGRGNRFTLTLPLPASTNLQRRPTLPASRLAQRSILLAEDSPTVRRVLTDWLTGWGMRVTAADGGQSALNALRQSHAAGRPFDMVLLDTRMPRPSGFVVAEQLSRHRWTKGPILLLVSPPQRRDDDGAFRRLGIHAVVVKPVRQNELHQLLAHALDSSVTPVAAS